MEKSEFIEFDLIRGSLYIQSDLFGIYLKEVFSDLSQRSDSDKDQGISKITFNEYMKLPIFINTKFFNSLDKDNNGFLNFNEFSEGMNKLFLGTFEETAKIIFSAFDFDKDGTIQKADVKLLLSYLPLKSKDDKASVYKHQIESLEELDETLTQTFGKDIESMNFEQYLKTIETHKSDIYIQLLCFLYFKKPFSENTIEQYRKLKKNNEGINSPQKNVKKAILDIKNINLNGDSPSRRIPSPSKTTKFLPAETYLQISNLRRLSVTSDENSGSNSPQDSPRRGPVYNTSNQNSENFSITLNTISKITNSPKKTPNGATNNRKSSNDGNNEFIRMPNRKLTTNPGKSNIDEMLKSSKNFYQSPSKIMKTPHDKIVELNLSDNLISTDNNSEGSECLSHEDWLYMVEKDNKIKKYYAALIGKEISIYRTNIKDDLVSLLSLSGCFIKDLGSTPKVFEKEKYYGFSIVISKDKSKNFYCLKNAAKEEWINLIKKASGYQNFSDFYEVNTTLGEGLFGVVKKAVCIKNNQIVAVKIINKDKLLPGEIDLIRTEIDLMKLFHHPNIVTLLDHFENAESIYIVMEFLEGGTLLDYLEAKSFYLNEKLIAKIIYNIGSVIKYLNSYGVLHRDLKPENIMLTDKSDNPVIKIIDFGLTRTLAPGEKIADGFGTITYVAPEVLTRKPYNKQIDIWSMGVILYFLLSSGKLPFYDDNNNEEVIAKKAVLMDPSFPEELFSKRSKSAMLLVNDCLIKDPEKRITIDNFLKNEWLKLNLNSKEKF